MKRLIFMLIFSTVFFVAFGQESEIVASKFNFFDFVKNMDALNFALLGIATFAGVWWKLGRVKLKQLGELCLKAYEYTDDKVLDKKERADLLNDLLILIGRTSLPKVLSKKDKRKLKKQE